MLILHEGELLYTDSSTDILEHYGVKGMKWGKRLRSAATKLYDDHKENLRYKSYKNHAKTTTRRKKDKTYTEKYSGK